MSSVEAPATAEAGPSDGPDEQRPALLTAGPWGIALLSVLFAWWTWQEGAYFDVTLFAGLIALGAGVLILARRAPWQLDLARSPAVGVALGGLVMLGCWSVASALWSPAPDTAVADGQRVLTYALCFGCGLWFCSMLGRRVELALLPLTLAGAVGGGVAVYALLTGDDPRTLLEPDGTLKYPLGYRNANAAFFAIAVFPAIGLAGNRAIDWRARGLALGSGTLCLSLFLFTQSRASLLALLVGVVVLLLASPRRLRTLTWLALAAIPALAVIPAAVTLHGAGTEPLLMAGTELRVAGRAAGFAALASVAIGMLAVRFERRATKDTDGARGNRAVAVGMAVTALVGAVVFIASVGNPIDWVNDRIDEFENVDSPDLSDRGTRFSFNAGSGRYDVWRVALEETADAPLLGTGGGGFQYAYTRERESANDLRDAHSIELETLSELGIPGLVMLAFGIGGGLLGTWRSRSAGPGPAGLTAVALAVSAYWLVHSSVDWFWPYPAISASVLALLGAASAPAAMAKGPPRRRPWRVAALVGVAILGLSAIPPLISDRYVDAAYEGWRDDRELAYENLERASSLNPLSEEPLLAEGAIARADGDRERAIDAFRRAADKRPEEWAAHYYVAALSASTDRAMAREEVQIALFLNPGSKEVRDLALRLGVTPPPFSYSG